MKRLKLNRWLISILTIAMLYLVFQPENSVEPVSVKVQVHDSDYYMEKVSMTQFEQSGELINQLKASRLEHWNESDTSLLDNPTISFNKNKQSEWVLNSRKGKIIKNNSTIFLENNVTILEQLSNNKVEATMSTEELTINLDKKIADTNKSVLIESQYYTTRSNGLKIDFDASTVNLKNHVRTEIKK